MGLEEASVINLSLQYKVQTTLFYIQSKPEVGGHDLILGATSMQEHGVVLRHAEYPHRKDLLQQLRMNQCSANGGMKIDISLASVIYTTSKYVVLCMSVFRG